jgi:four helix bundle protein
MRLMSVYVMLTDWSAGMAKTSSFRELVVWQKAMALAARVYRMTAQWPKTHQFGLGSPVQRSATSIPANIAEGFERHSRKEYLRFLAIAAGSAAETETHLRLSALAGITRKEDVAELVEATREVARIIRGIERRLAQPPRPAPPA